MQEAIPLVYWNVPNFGDMLSPYIVNKISGMNIKHKECYRGRKYIVTETIKRLIGYVDKSLDSINYPYQHNVLAIGSILAWGNGNSYIWGSGFMNCYDTFKGDNTLAVRGKLSDLKLQRMGFKGCAIYGDPALLLPKIYTPKFTLKYKYGIIPHIIETDYFKERYSNCKIIDLRNKDVEFIIEEICSCKVVLSTSLHGIIVAHAYGIPALWIKKHYINTDGFKFLDYFSSVGISDYTGIDNIDEFINKEFKIEELFHRHKEFSLPNNKLLGQIQTQLLEVAPFNIII